MSNLNYTNDILNALELNSINGFFIPMPYPHSDSCFRFEKLPNGSTIKYVNIVSFSQKYVLIVVLSITMNLKVSEKYFSLIPQMVI